MSRLKRLKEDGSHVPPAPPYLESLDILHPGDLAAAGRHAGVEEGGGDADPERLGRHVGLVDHGVGGDHAEGAEQEDEEVLAVGRQRGHQPVHRLHLFRTLLHLDDVEDGGLVLRTEDSARDLAEKLLHDAGNGVEGVVLHVDEPPLHQRDLYLQGHGS